MRHVKQWGQTPMSRLFSSLPSYGRRLGLVLTLRGIPEVVRAHGCGCIIGAVGENQKDAIERGCLLELRIVRRAAGPLAALSEGIERLLQPGKEPLFPTFSTQPPVLTPWQVQAGGWS